MKVERLIDTQAHDHPANQVDLKLYDGDIIVCRNWRNFVFYVYLF